MPMPYLTSEGKHSQEPIMPHHPTLTSSFVDRSFYQQIALFLPYYTGGDATLSKNLLQINTRTYYFKTVAQQNIGCKSFWATFMHIQVSSTGPGSLLWIVI